MSLQENMIRSAKNVIFSLLCILVDRPMGGLEPPNPSPAYALALGNTKQKASRLLIRHYKRTLIKNFSKYSPAEKV